jgi:DNA-binding MarR family transcriptional regulator
MAVSSAFGEVPGLTHGGDEPHLVREILRTYQVLMAGFSRRVGMPASRFALMRLLAAAGGDVGVMDLAAQLGINAAAVTRQLQDLEAEGLVRRRAHPRDGRRTLVRLSARGRRTFAAIHERSHELESRLAAILGAAEMKAAAAVLAKLRGIVEKAGQ